MSDLERISSDESDGTADDGLAPATAKEKEKKKAYKYKDADDIRILLEVLEVKPVGVGKATAKKWQEIHTRLGLPVPNYRSIQSRFHLLMKAFKNENYKSLRASGTEEDFDEKKRLLTDINDQLNDWEKEEKQASVSQKQKTDEEYRRASEIRSASLRSLNDPDTPPNQAPSTQRKRRHTNYEEILQASETERNDLERKRLQLMERQLEMTERNDNHRREMEERRLAFEERQLEAEAEKRAKDHEERTLLYKILSRWKE